MSSWISRVDGQGQPRNAVTVIFVFAAVLLCTILPSQVAFTSLVSAGGVPTIAAYALIAGLRLFCTPNTFRNSHFFLGRWRKLCYAAAMVFNIFIVAVFISPYFFPVTADTFNFASVIFGAVSLFGVASWWLTPAEKWLRQEQVEQALRFAERETASVEYE
jgi:translation initiation factor 5B